MYPLAAVDPETEQTRWSAGAWVAIIAILAFVYGCLCIAVSMGVIKVSGTP
jgi:hypothetical protein